MIPISHQDYCNGGIVLNASRGLFTCSVDTLRPDKTVSCCYVRNPENNIIELESWH